MHACHALSNGPCVVNAAAADCITERRAHAHADWEAHPTAYSQDPDPGLSSFTHRALWVVEVVLMHCW